MTAALMYQTSIVSLHTVSNDWWSDVTIVRLSVLTRCWSVVDDLLGILNYKFYVHCIVKSTFRVRFKIYLTHANTYY